MKKMLALCTVFALLICAHALAEIANVTTPDQLVATLNDPAIDAIEITADMTITDSYVMQTKDITILSDVVFQPAPDEGFFVKSWEIPEGVTLTVKGKLTTVHTFDTGFVIAQAYVNGGTMDIGEGTVSDDCNICFNAGTLIAPATGFGPDVAVERYLYENVTEQAITDALAVEELKTVTVQAECTICGSITVPDNKELRFSTVLTIADGGCVNGNVTADSGCGVILLGNAQLNEIAVPNGMEACMVIWTEDGSYMVTEYSKTPVAVTVGEWLETQGMCGNCTLTVTIKEIINPVLALVGDDSGTVNLFGLTVNGEFTDFLTLNLQAGDVLVLENPVYNEYDGSIEMAGSVLVERIAMEQNTGFSFGDTTWSMSGNYRNGTADPIWPGTLTLNTDGTGHLCSDVQDYDLTWSMEGNEIVLSTQGQMIRLNICLMWNEEDTTQIFAAAE